MKTRRDVAAPRNEIMLSRDLTVLHKLSALAIRYLRRGHTFLPVFTRRCSWRSMEIGRMPLGHLGNIRAVRGAEWLTFGIDIEDEFL